MSRIQFQCHYDQFHDLNARILYHDVIGLNSRKKNGIIS